LVCQSGRWLTVSAQQEDKPEVKKDADVEMKSEEPPASAKHGDISPINGSVSNLADDNKPSTSKAARKIEPLFEKLPNFSRVMPAQLAHITFPADGRYQPVRAVSTKAPSGVKSGKSAVAPAGSKSATAAIGLSSEKYAGGGGILILVDQSPDQEAEFIEFEPPAIALAPAEVAADGQNGHAIAGPAASGPHIALDENAPEADPPESFEVR
jgi:26S proteasome regulatory subunit N2